MTQRTFITPVEPIQDNGIREQYEIEKASWIWHPDFSSIQHVFLHFKNEFELAQETSTTIHVSGDQRYELYLDGELLSRGPDRCDKLHWSFATYDLNLPAGKHELTAEVYWIGEKSPVAQMSSLPGFILAAEGLEEQLNTGFGNWQVAERTGLKMGDALAGSYHVVGPCYIIDGKEFFADLEYKKALVTRKQLANTTGMSLNERNLFPTSLPEQQVGQFSGGSIRAMNKGSDYPLLFSAEEESVDDALDFLKGPIEVPANTKINILWDLGNYYCAYNRLSVSGGAGAEIKMEWAESLYEQGEHEENRLVHQHKGNRDEIAGKVFFGFGDTFYPSGNKEEFRSFWWRAGRYILLQVKTADQPLNIETPQLETTRYALGNESVFSSSDPEIETFIPIGVRGMQMCSHETLMDCPYYEQLMYVGDSRLEMLTWYAISNDVNFPKRCIELFDWSRWKTGFVAERYPSDPYQLSLTFSTIWVYMVHDYMMWRGDLDWVKARLVGVRCLLENFRSLIQEDGLLHALPGWSFVDWVGGWERGMPAHEDAGQQSIVNLQFIFALQKAAAMERVAGDDLMAQRNEQLAAAIQAQVLKQFWVEEKSMLTDTIHEKSFSEHSQCLGLLTGTIPEEKTEACFNAMLEQDSIAKTTIYYSFYLLETFKLMNRGDLILKRLEQWKELEGKGLKTTVEQPEPSRSDCHAWGAHPIFHLHASLAGIRPLEPGLKKILVKPAPGNLKFINNRIPHPLGEITLALQFTDDVCSGTISLPPETTGTFEWQGKAQELSAGGNDI